MSAPPERPPESRGSPLAPESPAVRLRRLPWGDLAFALGVLALGGYFAFGAFEIRVLPSYARIGPRFFPLLVALGLLGCGVLLTALALRGVAGRPEEAEDVDADAPSDWRAVAWLGAGLLADVLLMRPLGFVLASTALFWLTAIGFGSRAHARTLGIGFALALLVYLAFTQLLDLTLPQGVLPF